MKIDSRIWQRDIADFIPFLKKSKSIPPRELGLFCRKLSFMLDAGIPVKDALPIVAEQSSTKVFKGKLNDVHICILRGDSFSGALGLTGMFPAFMCGLVGVGELSAYLPHVLEQLADYYEQRAKTEESLKAAMIYPGLVAGMMLMVMVIAVTYVLPNFARVFAASEVDLPELTQWLFRFSGFITGYPHVIFPLIIAFVGGVFLFAGSKAANRLLLYIPLYRQGVNLRFTQALSVLLTSGQSLTVAVPACSKVLGNRQAEKDMLNVAAGLNEGRAFWETLSQIPYMDTLLIGMIRVGEETGHLTQTLEKCRRYFTQAHQQNVSRTSKLIEPAITIILGLLLGFVMMAIILPTFSLMDVV